MKTLFTRVENINRQRAESGQFYREFLRIPAMSAGMYVLSAGSIDPQSPHHQDELYYVIRGRGRFRAGGQDTEVSAGSVLFVAAEVEHKFYDVEEELSVLVFFAPAES
ncbi:MAG: cupin domain-containing protein [Candidatus Sulfotelmatobacter sp.]